MTVLGIWQLHRYDYKKLLLATYQHLLNAPPVSFLELKTPGLEFQHISVTGQYMNNLTMLVQNQFYHDQIGFEVLTPLQIAGQKKLLLIDRGWVAELPAGQVMGKQKITGHIKLINEYQFMLGKNILNASASPIVMQKIDMAEISQVTHQDFYPFIVRLDATEPHGFVRDWTITTVPPARHMGYAVQWFVMALVLLIAYGCFSCERKNGK